MFHHTFLFLLCDDFPFINTMQKNFKTFQMFQFPGWMEKKLQTLEFQQIHEMQVASKKVYWKNNRVFQTLGTYHHWKRYFSELNRCIFQISLKYIKFVIPKILLILVLCNFTWPLTNKIRPLPPTNIIPSLPHQNKNFWSPHQRLF